MAVTTDILRTWRGPRGVMRELLAQGKREDRAVAYLIVACLLIFVAQWPRLVRLSEGFGLPPGQTAPDLTQLIAYEFLGWLMIWPLALYGLAAISHLVARIAGGRGTWFSARLALFWSLLASVPVLLLHGLVQGLVGPGAQANLVGAIWLVAFAVVWVQCLREAERRREARV